MDIPIGHFRFPCPARIFKQAVRIKAGKTAAKARCIERGVEKVAGRVGLSQGAMPFLNCK
jgi:hypothetical protein